MRTRHSFLIRFIDLGLLLLMAFLATANLSPKIQVALPHGAEAAAAAQVHRVLFGATEAVVRPERGGAALCQVYSLRELATCLRALANRPAPVLLSPTGAATVQRLVHVMDLCERLRLMCTIAPLP